MWQRERQKEREKMEFYSVIKKNEMSFAGK
jgi:hypothetical protein